MRIDEIIKSLELEVLQPEYENSEIQGCYTSDLLSDVMAHAESGHLLITIQAHKNTVAVASLIGIPAIIIANGRPMIEDMLDAAQKERIGVFRSTETQFILSGKLYTLLYPTARI